MTRLLRFWKPYGVLSKFTDEEGRPTLKDYIHIPNVYAAGRLDMDSEGLLLLTDDSRVAKRLTDPEFAHPRTYHVLVERMPDDDALQKLREGLNIQGYRTRPARVKRLLTPPDFPPRDLPPKYEKAVPTTWIELTLTEGKNRQVRRMTAAVGHPTIRLVRVAVGDILLDGLAPGEFEELGNQDIESIRRLIRWQS